MWLAAAVLALIGVVVRLIGLVPSGLVLSGSSHALGFFVLEGDGPLHHVLQPDKNIQYTTPSYGGGTEGWLQGKIKCTVLGLQGDEAI